MIIKEINKEYLIKQATKRKANQPTNSRDGKSDNAIIGAIGICFIGEFDVCKPLGTNHPLVGNVRTPALDATWFTFAVGPSRIRGGELS